MNTLKPVRAVIWEDSSLICLARVIGNAGTAITQASISAIGRKVFNVASGQQISSTALVVADVVFDTLQLDARWTIDSIGYNMADNPAAADFSDPNQLYRVEYSFTPVSGQPFKAVFEVTTLSILGS